jgi:simple sugar transport system permease protein
MEDGEVKVENPTISAQIQGVGFRLRSSFHLQLAAMVIALLLCALFIRLAGQNPLVAAVAVMHGAVGNESRLAESLSKTIPLVMTGLSVVIAFRAGFFNIGAEGQFLAGALVGTAMGTKLSMPVPLVLIGGALGGALWAGLAEYSGRGAARPRSSRRSC